MEPLEQEANRNTIQHNIRNNIMVILMIVLMVLCSIVYLLSISIMKPDTEITAKKFSVSSTHYILLF